MDPITGLLVFAVAALGTLVAVVIPLAAVLWPPKGYLPQSLIDQVRQGCFPFVVALLTELTLILAWILIGLGALITHTGSAAFAFLSLVLTIANLVFMFRHDDIIRYRFYGRRWFNPHQNWAWWGLFVIMNLPTAYLWYLLAVGMGLLPS